MNAESDATLAAVGVEWIGLEQGVLDGGCCYWIVVVDKLVFGQRVECMTFEDKKRKVWWKKCRKSKNYKKIKHKNDFQKLIHAKS